MLKLTDVTKRYGALVALDHVSLEVASGEVVAVIGSNGAGKTTLIKCALGLVKFEGSATAGEFDVARHGKEARRLIGYLPQNPALHTDLTVAETAVFYADLKRVPGAGAHAVVDRVGLSEHANKPVAALSGGMKQRLALAIALLSDPPILILDEPASSLDVNARIELRRLLQEQRSAGHAILLSTHWLEDLPMLADRALVLDQGKAIFLGATSDLITGGSVGGRLYLRLNGHGADAAELIRQAVNAEVDRSGDWVVVTCTPGQKTRVLETLVRAGVGILDLRVEEATIDGMIQRLHEAGPAGPQDPSR